MRNIVCDLETAGKRAGCAIFSIGATYFDQNDTGLDFYKVIDLRSCEKFGLTIDPDTMLWWMRQSDAARNEINNGGAELIVVLQEFAEFCELSDGDVNIWGNDSVFDCGILRECYRVTGIPDPWGIFRNRCYRTMKDNFPEVPRVKPPADVAHNALIDAIYEARHLQQIFKHLGREPA